MDFYQGEVWDVDFGPPGGVHPGVIVSRNELNRGQLILTVPCTDRDVSKRSQFTNNVFLPTGAGGLDEDSVAQAHLIAPVEREYFRSRRGMLSQEQLGLILWALVWAVDWLDGA